MTFPITAGHFTRTSSSQATSSTISGAIGQYIYVAGIFDVAGVISSIVTDGGDTFTFDSINVGGVSKPTPYADVLGVAKVYVARVPALTAAATEVTINFSTAQSFVGGFVWTGSNLTSPVIDQSSYATGSSTTPNSGTTATLSGSADDAIAFAYSFNSVSGINSPWTSEGLDSIGDVGGHQSLSSTAAISAGFTASNDSWGALAIAYKSGSGGGPTLVTGAAKGASAARGQATPIGKIVIAFRSGTASPGQAAAKLLAPAAARGAGVSSGRAGRQLSAPASARGASVALGRAGRSLAASLSANSVAAGQGKASLTGKATAAARGMSASFAKFSSGTVTAVTAIAQGLSFAFGRASPLGTTKVNARSVSSTSGKAGSLGSAKVAASGTSASFAKASLTGKASAAARSMAAAFGKFSPSSVPIAVTQIAKSISAAFGRALLLGTTTASAKGQAAAHAKMSVTARSSLDAISTAAASGRAVLTGRTTAAAKSISAAFGHMSAFSAASAVTNAARSIARAWGWARGRLFVPSTRVARAQVTSTSAAVPLRSNSAMVPPIDNETTAPPGT